MGDEEACELTPWCSIRQELAAPQGISSQWGEQRDFRWNQGSEVKKRILVNHRAEKPGTRWPHADLVLVVPPTGGKASAEEEDLESSQSCRTVGAVESGYSRTGRVNISVNANAQNKVD